jgi:hypothetical protein
VASLKLTVIGLDSLVIILIGHLLAVSSTVGLKPLTGIRIKGDIGILRGYGKQTIQRIYWANKATAMVSDVRSEAELTPKLWGTWEFDQK